MIRWIELDSLLVQLYCFVQVGAPSRLAKSGQDRGANVVEPDATLGMTRWTELECKFMKQHRLV
jgi:hypothetical protein